MVRRPVYVRKKKPMPTWLVVLLVYLVLQLVFAPLMCCSISFWLLVETTTPEVEGGESIPPPYQPDFEPTPLFPPSKEEKRDSPSFVPD